MTICKCTQIFRDKNGKIKGYRLVDIQGNQLDLLPAQLKNYINTGQFKVINLKLTSDNRLINIKEKDSEQNNSVNRENIVLELPKLYIIKKDLKASIWTATEEERAFGWEDEDKRYAKGSVLQLVAEDKNNIYLCSYYNINPINDVGKTNKDVAKISKKYIGKTVLSLKDTITIPKKLRLKKDLVINLHSIVDMYGGTELLDIMKDLIDSFGSESVKKDFSKYGIDLDSYNYILIKIPKETEVLVESYNNIKIKSHSNKYILLGLDSINYGFTNACDMVNLINLIGVDKSWINN